jgi:hypothetical protein
LNSPDVPLVESLGSESFDDKDDEHPNAIIEEMNREPEAGISSLLVESLRALESAVDGLYRLGVAIRQSSPVNLTQRINAFIQKKDDGILEAMVLIHLKHRLVDEIKRVAKTKNNESAENVGASLSLCRQLALSITFRYFGILYNRSHTGKIEVKRETDLQTGWLPKTALSTSETANPKSSPFRHTAQKPPGTASNLRGNDERSDTAPTIPVSKKAREALASSNSPFTGTRSFIAERQSHIKYPDPPKVDSLARDGVCPYCCKRIPKASFEKKELWE